MTSPASPPSRTGAGGGEAEGARVMVVEDDPSVSSLVARALAGLGATAVVRAGPDDALEAMAAAGFDLVIADYRLGDVTSGELLSRIREDDPVIPILLMSAAMDRDDLARVVGTAVDEYLDKPLDVAYLLATVRRLLRLGAERRRAADRMSVLLDVAARIKVGEPVPATLRAILGAVPALVPFRSSTIVMREDAPGLPPGDVAGLPAPEWAATQSVALLDDAAQRGYRLENAVFCPAFPDASAVDRRYNAFRAHRRAWEAGDQVLAEVASLGRRWGYLVVGDPVDGTRPTEQTLRSLSRLARMVGNVLENDQAYGAQRRLNFQLEVVAEIVKTALQTTDLPLIKRMIADAAVGRFGLSFACFIEKDPDGTYRTECVTCRDMAEYRRPLSFAPVTLERLREIERTRQPLRLRAVDGASSLVGRTAHRSSFALPIFTGEVLRHVFLVESDGDQLGDADFLVYSTMADQIGLIWSLVLYQGYLEKTATELRESYARLQDAHAVNVRLQNIIKRYVPHSTWQSALQTTEADPGNSIETVAERAVMFIDVAGFTRISEQARPGQIVELLNTYFTLASSVVAQHEGEVTKYIGDGIMADFGSAARAVRAADDLLRGQARLNREVAGAGLGPIALRVGVAYGSVILCTVGPVYHQDRTLLGDTVNTASRLEQRARPGTALLDARLLSDGDRPEDYGLVALPSLVLKGKLNPVPVLTFARDQAAYHAAEGAKP